MSLFIYFTYLVLDLFYLDDAHVEAGFLRELFPDVARGLGRGRERCLQRLKLFGFDGGPRAAPLPAQVLVVVLVVHRFFVRQGGDFRVLHIILKRVLGVG